MYIIVENDPGLLSWGRMACGVSKIEFTPLTWETKEVYQRYYPTNIYALSDLAFSTLWIWRHVYHLAYSEHRGFFYLQCQFRGKTYFLPPLGPSTHRLSELINDLKAYTREHDLPFCIRGVPRELVPRLLAATENRGNIREDRAHWDYVYLTRDLIDLNGNKYRNKRSQIRRFATSHDYRYHPMTPADLPRALAVFDAWASAHPRILSVAEERAALLEALAAFEKLPLKGGYLEVDGQMVAFAIGSLLKPDTALIHFEKTLPELPDAYAVINREFTTNAWSGTEFINREDDLGLPGLREAKSRYHPVRMAEKYIFEWNDL